MNGKQFTILVCCILIAFIAIWTIGYAIKSYVPDQVLISEPISEPNETESIFFDTGTHFLVYGVSENS